MKKYKSLPVRDSAAAYNELVDNHISTAPQPCTSLLFITLICVYHTQLLIGSWLSCMELDTIYSSYICLAVSM